VLIFVIMYFLILRRSRSGEAKHAMMVKTCGGATPSSPMAPQSARSPGNRRRSDRNRNRDDVRIRSAGDAQPMSAAKGEPVKEEAAAS